MGKYLLLILIPVLTFTSCITTKYLQRADTFGLAHHYPVSITNKKKTLRPIIRTQIRYSNQTKIRFNTGDHTKVNKQGEFAVKPVEGKSWYIPDTSKNKYNFNGTNLTWNRPRLEFQANIDFPFSRHTSVVFGGSYGFLQGNHYWGIRLGFNFFWEYKTWAWNMESYHNYYNRKFNMDYISWDDSYNAVNYERVFFKNEIGSDYCYNLSHFLTINSKVSSWPVNFFIRTGFGNIELLKEVGNPEYSAPYWSITLGFYKPLFSFSRILLGTNFNHFSDEVDSEYVFDLLFQYEVYF